MTERIVGIDFGTSTSVIRVKRYEDGVPIGDANLVMPVTFNMGSTVVPTLIKETSSGKSYGYDAQIPKRNSTTYQNFKVDLESTDTEKKEEARKLTRDFFTYLAKVYNEQSDGGYLGDSTDKVRTLISYPVKWSDETKKFMIDTAKEAGFVNVEGMDEAQAAISAVLVQNADHFEKYGYLDKAQSVNVMLIDMGAGTTDLVLCKYYIKEKKTEIICTWPKEGNILFGGKEVDEILRGYVRSKILEEESEAILRRCGLEKFKAWKENFISPALKNNESVDEFSELDMLIDMMGTEVEDYTVNRTVFEEQAKDYLGRFTTLINGCIEESKTDAGDIDLVILTGGHSQWYFAEEIISGKTKTFGEVNLKKIVDDNNRIIPIVRPQETVAMGLVYSKLKQDAVVTTEPKPPVTPKVPETPETSEIPVTPEAPVAPVAQRTEMAIINVFELDGLNRIATNNIVPENTVIHVGDIVDFYRDENKFFSSVIRGICVGKENTTSAKGGDDVGILFEDVTVKIDKNDIIVIAENSVREPRKIAIATNRTPLNGGTVSGAGVYALNSKVTLTAVAAQGYKFNRWNDGNINASREITVKRDKTYVALFDKDNDIERENILKAISHIAEEAQINLKEMPYTPEYEFTVVNKGNICIISKYVGNQPIVSIPPVIAGKRVVGIGNYAFAGLTVFTGSKIQAVVIPDTVTEIGMSAFMGCTKLETVIAHRNIQIIGNNAFYGCNKLKEIDFDMGDCIKGKAIFPPGLKKIGICAFRKYKAPYGTRQSVFNEVFISKNTVVKDGLGDKTFHPKYTTVTYYG